MPPHDQNAVTVGECVAALVLTILTGEHAVSRVAATLAVYDLAVIVQRPWTPPTSTTIAWASHSIRRGRPVLIVSTGP